MFQKVLKDNIADSLGVLAFQLKETDIFRLDLSVDNEELHQIDLSSTNKLGEYINSRIKKSNKKLAVGGYAEDRLIYRKSSHFGKDEDARTIHLGIDIWCNEKTGIYSPIDGIIHSFKNNTNFGDYGPTIILQHSIGEYTFYTLYGHLSKNSLSRLAVGNKVSKGDKIAELGDDTENGNWPPHLHFQLIREMGDNYGDFPGVCSKKEKEKYLRICPNPELILNIK
ncbi:MAG: peptidase M23 [Marinilabiliales bacterium]|nr:MAG: peptidase M23 [Marinilabiliales bacterium]